MSDDDDDKRGPRDIDPEVLADLQLRAASERDPTRTREVDVNKLYKPFSPVADWKCRHPKCDVMCPVDVTAIETLAVFNAELRRRGEREIPTDAIMLCDDHRQLGERYRVEALQKRHVRLRDAIQKLKASDNPRSEVTLIEELRACHHPYVDELLTSLTDKLGKKPRGRPI